MRRDLLKHIGLGAITSLLASKAAAQPGKSSASKKIRGIVFLVSDGMSPGVLTLAQAFSKQIRKADTTWWQLLQRPDVVNGLMDTASANSLVTDSAAASSSWGSGQRVNNGMINVSPNGRSLEPIAWTLAERGIRTGLVSTASITHATPAGFAAQVKSRDDEQSIARQYLDRVDILLGGGLEFFQASTRNDKQDLPADYRAAGYQVAFDAKTLASSNSQKILGLFAPKHLPFSLDRNHDEKLKEKVPTLAAMATKALQTFLQSEKRFLLQVEGARIDHAAHLNDAAALLHDQLAYDDAAAAIIAMLQGRDDVLVILTSDHGNSNPGLNGMGASYQKSNECFAKVAAIKASFPSMQERLISASPEVLVAYIKETTNVTLRTNEAQAIATSMAGKDVTEWNHLLAKPEGLLAQMLGNHTGIGWTGTVHTSDPTLLTSLGPGASRFHGIVKNSDIHGHLLELLS